jgi:APA family basic amino acid/polyamine antiporter
MYLRYARPEMKRPFRTPLFPLVPILGVLMCLLLLLSIMANHDTRNFFLIYLVVGIALYFAYGMRHSKLRQGVVVEGHEAEPMELPHVGD